jgi:glucokinase
VYANQAGLPLEQAPEPKVISEIGLGTQPGDRAAAVEAFRQLGEVTGDAMGNALTLLDSLAVIGGGLSGAWPLFLSPLVAELNGTYACPNGQKLHRLASTAFNLQDASQMEKFVQGEAREIRIPYSDRTLKYDPAQRIGVGISRLGTSEAIAIGAYAFALGKSPG